MPILRYRIRASQFERVRKKTIKKASWSPLGQLRLALFRRNQAER
jgi:hypothetical protein